MFRSPIFQFYKNFTLATGTITCSGLVFCIQAQSLPYSFAFTFAKGITNLLIGLIFLIFRKNELIYYNNLGLPSSSLYVKVFSIDMAIWLLLLVITSQM